MAVVLTDAEIAGLIAERKVMPDLSKLDLKSKRGHKERDAAITGIDGGEFEVILRQSNFNPLDFSVILGYQLPKSTQLFRLRRYNGKSHEHTNKIEGNTFYDFHIHDATERYQASGFDEDAFAQPTSRYQDFSGALQCLLADCAFEKPSSNQPTLF